MLFTTERKIISKGDEKDGGMETTSKEVVGAAPGTGIVQENVCRLGGRLGWRKVVWSGNQHSNYMKAIVFYLDCKVIKLISLAA